MNHTQYQLPNHLKQTKKEEKQADGFIKRILPYFKKGLITGIIISIVIFVLEKII